MRLPKRHPYTYDPPPRGPFRGFRYASVEMWRKCWWIVPCPTRQQARETRDDARAEGTPAWVIDSGKT